MSSSELERWANRTFSRLPTPTAPPTLLPRVMAAVPRTAFRRWYRRPWPAWPRGWQVASLAASLAVMGGILLGLPRVETAIGRAIVQRIGEVGYPGLELVTMVRIIAETAASVSNALPSGVTLVLNALLVVMLAAIAVLCATIHRVTSMQGLQS